LVGIGNVVVNHVAQLHLWFVRLLESY
jgi:hypothetical protein